MQKEIKIYEFILPTWTLSYLINGDFSGLTEKEHKMLVEFEKELFEKYGNGHWNIESGEKYFSWYNDLTDLGSDVMDCSYIVIS